MNSSPKSNSNNLYRRVLYESNVSTTYHRYENCPRAQEISQEVQQKIVFEQIAQSKGMHLCETCRLMDEPHEDRPDDIPYNGVDVDPIAKIGVALSGGGHRATIFGLGVLMYLVHARRDEDMSLNNDVFEISSVSGGSITNGYVAQMLDYQKTDVDEFDQVAGELASQIAQGGTLFAPWWAKIYIYILILLAVISVGGIVGVLFAHKAWSLFWITTGVSSLVLFLLFGIVAQFRGFICEKAFVRTLFSPSGVVTKLASIKRSVLHVICSTDVQTGNAAYFSPGFVYCKDYKPRYPEELTLAKAIRASAALPVAFPPCYVRLQPGEYPSAWSLQKRKPKGMLLVDGGVRDNLGADWFTDPARRQEVFFHRMIF